MISSISEQLFTPVSARFDVIVAGGGPAGFAAAVGAARMGNSVALFDVNGALGGVWTAGLLCHIIDWRNKSGTMAEIMTRLRAEGGAAEDDHSYDPEVMKYVLDSMARESGIRVQLHTRVVAAQHDLGRVSSIATESKSGREAWQAAVFIDATGDGDLAALAGCGFEIGHPVTGETQPMSLMAVLAGLNDVNVAPFVCGPRHGHKTPKERLLSILREGGLEPSYSAPTLFKIADGLYALMGNHEYGVSALDAHAITQASMNARSELRQIEVDPGIRTSW